MRSAWKIPTYTTPAGSFLLVRGCPWGFQVHPTRRAHLYTGQGWQNTRVRQPMLTSALSVYVQSCCQVRSIRQKFAKIAAQAARKKATKKK